MADAFFLKFQRNDRQNALAIGSRESWRKRLYFHRAVDMKQPHPLTEPSKTIASYGRSHLLKNCFSTENTTRLMVASLWEQCWQIWPFADGSVRVHGCFCFGNRLKIYAFLQIFRWWALWLGDLLLISLEFQGNKASTVFYDTVLRIWFYSGFSFAKAGQKSFIPDSSELGHMASKKKSFKNWF